MDTNGFVCTVLRRLTVDCVLYFDRDVFSVGLIIMGRLHISFNDQCHILMYTNTFSFLKGMGTKSHKKLVCTQRHHFNSKMQLNFSVV